MRVWRVSPGSKIDVHTHAFAPGFGHSLLAPLVANVFEVLRVTAAVRERGIVWFTIHDHPNLMRFEQEHGKEAGRAKYNERLFGEVERHKKTVRGEHAGYSDLFVPILVRGQVAATLAAGPFALSRASAPEVLARFRWLTGRLGHPTDPEFASYLALALSTLVLDREGLASFEQMLDCIAGLMAGQGQAEPFANRAELLLSDLVQVRSVERMWEAVREMVDERSSQRWQSVHQTEELRRLGLSRGADHVLVGLTVSRASNVDPVDEVIRRDAFQRSSVELARKVGNVVAGQVGDHGVVFLSASSASSERKRQRLLELAERASLLARRDFGLSIHFGASVARGSALVSDSYQAALGAAESALAQGTRIVLAEPGASRPRHSLRHLRQELARAVEEKPDLLAARFDRYLEAVAALSGNRVDAARGHLEAGFERIAEPLVGGGALDRKSFSALWETLDRAAGKARTSADLFAAYRQAIQDVSAAVRSPVKARQDRSLRNAVEYVHQHYTEPLTLKQLARMAGFTQSHFSRLFIVREQMPFERYLRGLRLERAKQLLEGSELNVTRVAERSGFSSVFYFCRVFRHEVGSTPLEYREGSGKGVRSLLHQKTKSKS